MQTYGGVEACLKAFLISALDGSDGLALRFVRFNPEAVSPYTFHRLDGPQSQAGHRGKRNSALPEVDRFSRPIAYPLYWMLCSVYLWNRNMYIARKGKPLSHFLRLAFNCLTLTKANLDRVLKIRISTPVGLTSFHCACRLTRCVPHV
jgi:hypothetical protein